MDMQNIGLAVHLDSEVLTGIISLASEIRLSDFVNYDLVGQSETIGIFLKLTDATISRADGTKERTKTIYINRANVQMLRTLEKDSARGIGARDGLKHYPFVHKLPVRIMMHMPRYELSGYVHYANEKRFSQLLAQERAFLPCTDVKIRETGSDEWWRADFVAINKGQIGYFQQEE
jgi:hypothetical protein